MNFYFERILIYQNSPKSIVNSSIFLKFRTNENSSLKILLIKHSDKLKFDEFTKMTVN